MSDLLDEGEVTAALKKMPDWELEGNSIERTVEFEEFMEAIDFVNLVAEVAEDSQHHPEIDIRFSQVVLRLRTEDVGGVTELDIEMAHRIDNLAD
jgi:4a-hydroxytetrahydrobiopterin dehydratase